MRCIFSPTTAILAFGLAFFSFGASSILAQPSTFSLPDVPNSSAISIAINGAAVSSDPEPIVVGGSVYVPLRGVLEKLGAKVSFGAAQNRIEVVQNGKTIVLRPGAPGATVNTEAVTLVPPFVRGGRAFVPLRALAEIFGYAVSWVPASRLVQISDDKPLPQNHRAALDLAGIYGVSIDFHRFAPDQIPSLFEAAQSAGFGLVKTKFDWPTLEKARGAAFDWKLYDAVVAEARRRRIVLVGVFGDTAPWASSFTGPDQSTARRSPPLEKDLPLWSNYVRRVVGRYHEDVHAWQVWTAPNATNWLSVPRNYRRLASAAVAAAKTADKTAIVHLAEPGGADLQTFLDWRANGTLTAFDGVAVQPVSSWQQGTLAAPEDIVRPFTELLKVARISGGPQDFWVGGVNFPVATLVDKKRLGDAERQYLQSFSLAAQADHLVKTFALGRALGAPKVFWGALRDSALEPVRGITLASGLMGETGTPRPAYRAAQTFISKVGDKPFERALAFTEKAAVLLFDDKKEGVVVAWSPLGDGALAISTNGINPQVEGAAWVDMRPDGQVLSADGEVLKAVNGLLKIGKSPIFLTGVSLKTLQESPPVPLLLAGTRSFGNAREVSAQMDETTAENGLYWREYQNFPAEAQGFNSFGSRSGLTTQPQLNPLDLRSMKPFIHFDVDDSFVFNSPGESFELVIDVKRPSVATDSIVTSVAGFRVEYDSVAGDRSSRFLVVEPGEGWQTFTLALDQAQFANANGYDLLIDAAGSKQPLTFGKIRLRKVAPSG